MWKKLLAGVLTAALLGIGGVAVAGAVGTHSGSSSSSDASTAPTSSNAAKTARSRRLTALRRAAKLAADTIGISVRDLRSAVKDGQTVGAVAEAHHVDPQHVVDALVQAADARIDAALKAGKITSERATKLRQRVPTLADEFVNHTQDLIARARTRGNARATRRADVIAAAAAAIGVSATDLRNDLRSGQSIADVATAHHVAVQHVVDALVAAATAKIDAAVKAGTLTSARAAALEQRLPALMQRVVSRQRTAGATATALAPAV